MRLTIEQYSKRYKMSKEMINSKIKSKKLNYIMENGETYIIVPEEPKKNISIEQKSKSKITVATIIELYKKENKLLKEKIKQLEEKIDKLIDDKEQMLIAERERIEKVYASKDEQLKNILELLNQKLKFEQKNMQDIKHEEILAIGQIDSNIVDLKTYLKSLDLTSYERKKLKKRFQEVKGQDIRVQEQDGKIFLDFNKYDYSDLLSLH